MMISVLGKTYYALQDFVSAKASYTKALEIDPSNEAICALLFFNRGLVNYRLKQFGEAISDCNNALKINNQYVKALLICGNCYMEFSMYEKAITYYKRALVFRNDEEVLNSITSAEDSLSRWKDDDYFVLKINFPASISEVKTAYKKLSLTHHPDKHSDSPEDEKLCHQEVFKRISQAKTNLLDQNQ